MKLKYSNNNVPYIDLENGMLIFSRTTETSKGFKYMAFKANNTNSICIPGSKAKKKKYAKVSEDVSFPLNMNFKRPVGTDREHGIPREARFCLSSITEKILKKLFEPLIEDGYFPRKNLPKLESEIEKLWGGETDEWDEDPTALESYDDIGEEKNGKTKNKKIKLKKKPKVRLKISKPRSLNIGK